MIKLLLTTARMPINGISNVMMQYFRCLDKNKYEITVLTSKIDDIYKEEIERGGGKLILWDERESNQIKYFFKLKKLLKEQRFDIIHEHGNSATMAVEMFAAKRAKTPVRIAHSHNVTCTHQYFDKLLRPLFYRSYTHGFACGEDAGRWMFRNRAFTVINNGVDLKRFAFNAKKRREIRANLGIEDKFVIGHIGRFNYQKNHEFLIDVYARFAQQHSDSVLLLVGEGPEFDNVKQKVYQLGLGDNVIFYGTTGEPEVMYAAFDVFAFPSRFEGLGFVLVETQASGLPAIINDGITDEAVCTPFVEKESTDSVDGWVQKLETVKTQKSAREENSQSAVKALDDAGFSLEAVARQLDTIYTTAVEARG